MLATRAGRVRRPAIGPAATSRTPATARTLALVAIAGQAAFAAAWVVAGALEPGYSHADSPISALAARTAESPWVARAGIVALGGGIAALGAALRPALPRRPAATASALLFVAAGALLVVTGLLPLDCDPEAAACRARRAAGELSAEHRLHLALGVPTQLLLVATPFALARALWPGRLARTLVAAGLGGVAVVVALTVAAETGGADGLVQRLGFGVVHAWVAFVALAVVRRPPDRRSS